MNIHQKILKPYYDLSEKEKKNLVFLALTYFVVLFSYPIIRSTSDAFLIQMYGAKNWPWANVMSIIVLMGCVTIYNSAQPKHGMKRLFYFTSLISAIFFGASAFMYSTAFKPWAFIFFIWKEAYIVILVHMCLGFFNTHFSYEFAKSFFGPFGGFTSIGSIAGGLITTFLVKAIGVSYLIGIGAASLLLVPFLVRQLDEDSGRLDVKKERKQPLKTLSGVWTYVLLIIGIVICSQFLINIFNFKFNFFVQDAMPLAVDKTAFYGKTYTTINVVSLAIQFIMTPIALKSLHLRTNHYFVVGMYVFALVPLMVFSSTALMVVSSVFIISKAFDYTFFGTIKELLYYPLTEMQKYGAKYVTDMVMYRASKLFVSVFLGLIQSFTILNGLMVGMSTLWLILVALIFRKRNLIMQENTI